MSSFIRSRILAGIFTGPYKGARNVFICGALLVASICIPWSTWISHLHHHLRGPSPRQRESRPEDGDDATERGKRTSRDKGKNTLSDREEALEDRDNTSDANVSLQAEYSLQILHGTDNAAIEFVFAPQILLEFLIISASWPCTGSAQTRLTPGSGSRRTTLPACGGIPASRSTG
jgi:hypothetical protein